MPCNMRGQQDKENTTPPRERIRVTRDIPDRGLGSLPRPIAVVTPISAPLSEGDSGNRPGAEPLTLPQPPVIGLFRTDSSLSGSSNDADLHDSSDEMDPEQGYETPLRFQSFMSSVNVLLGPDSVFERLSQEGSARTSPVIADRYRSREPLPPISSLLRSRAVPDCANKQTLIAPRPISPELKPSEMSESESAEAIIEVCSRGVSMNSLRLDTIPEEPIQSVPLDLSVSASSQNADNQAPRCTYDNNNNTRGPRPEGL
ncbi:hypothetical protein EGW08_000988 [Elysia chlorotica]|uniref:Uncharacterized protein n=1 Tax=Elysia chlorotica TaxID=188477 RepID=A0A433UBU9_ELYCH|nr:hypothetical protein EGW08_000988 [Elysia chlorotica]